MYADSRSERCDESRERPAATAQGGVSAQEFAQRRRQLMRMAGDDAAVVVAAAPERMRSADAPWPYRQDSDFHYLSGFPEPDAVLALLPGRAHGEAVLFCRDHEVPRPLQPPVIGTEQAIASFGVDDAFPIDDIDDILPGMLEGRARVYCHFGREPEFDAHLLAWMRRLRALRGGGVVPKEFVDLGHLLHDMRLYKSRTELGLMRRAAQISAEAHCAGIRAVRPGVAEYEIEAEILRSMRSRGAVAAFPPNVAGGGRACIPHYHANREVLADGTLVLIDAGAEVECYAADITRTVPVNGRFSADQRILYDIVLEAQQAAIEHVRPEQPFSAAHDAAVRVIADGLHALGLLEGGSRAAIESGEVLRFFPHKTGHWLGMDVHDVGDYRVDGESRLLEPGMVCTVEPGIYIADDAAGVAPRWRGIGIRIEDVVAVTRHGPRVLTDGVPRQAEAVQDLLADRTRS